MKVLFLAIVFLFMNIPGFATPGDQAVTVEVDAPSGNYRVTSTALHWSFSGTVGQNLGTVKSGKGHDAIGNYHSVIFSWKNENVYTGTIRWYDDKPVILFSLTLPHGATQSPVAFPDFNSVPPSLFHFSYRNDVFSAPDFTLNETSTPWLLFDDHKNACVISPASDFIVSRLSGNGETRISSGLNPEVNQLPAGFTHRTIMIFDNGIRAAWDTWGAALRKLYNRRLPANDADPVLKYFGYWTDNGADYYYNYDTTRGYANTLLDLRKRYRDEQIPLGYIQLDSWWYEKSIYDPEGKPDADHKNKLLPEGKWNRYGGLMEYKADPFLFPEGLSSFHQKMGLPMVTHNRWVDPLSPYHRKYRISGYAATDPAFWNDIMGYLQRSGVVCYEQDWLNFIYNKSPEMIADIDTGNAFTDGMAAAAKAHGLDLQYCMAMPRFFLQGIRYNNLTTIRTSDDRFEPRKWMPFIFTSQLGYEMGIWPWCDVFKSREMGNMIVSVLSAGAVGAGDSIGREDRTHIMKACRNDGVLVKPDEPLLPVDEDYLQLAKNERKPLLAYTCTRHNPITTGYLFAFGGSKTVTRAFDFQPSSEGLKGRLAIYDPESQGVKILEANGTFSGVLPGNNYVYYIMAPVTSAGIAFFGDAGKIAATGKKRVAEIKASGKDLFVRVVFTEGEKEVTLRGYADAPVVADRGKVSFDPATHLFSWVLQAPGTPGSVGAHLRKS